MKRKTIRNRYHSDFKLAVFLGITDYEIIDSLPKSTIHSFRNLSPNEFRSLIGHSYSDSQFFDPEYLMLLKKIANAKTFIRILKAALRAKKCLLSIQRFPQRIAYDLQTKERIIRTIEKIRDTIGFEKSLRYFNISKAAYYLWLFEFRSQCDAAVSNLCLRRFPLQISNSEIEALKRLVYEKIQLGWPFSVIWGYGVRHRIIRFSKSTFMRYVRALGLYLLQSKFKKIRKTGFLTSEPNQVWHADITIYTTKDNVKAYIYFLVDNFSKFILGCEVKQYVSSRVCTEMIQEAYRRFGSKISKVTIPDLFPLLNLNLSKETNYINLMVDGGPENKGDVDRLISGDKLPINKIIAQKDVSFSNSQIEALNKILKYQFLHKQDIPNIQTLQKMIYSWIPIYNSQRPNRSGKYLLTPEEVYNGKKVDHLGVEQNFIDARRARILQNQKASCGAC